MLPCRLGLRLVKFVGPLGQVIGQVDGRLDSLVLIHQLLATDDPRASHLPEALARSLAEMGDTARLSLRRLSELAGISNPYLSQIERGLRRPSAEILQQIAKALRISAETLYVQAGILERPDGDTDLSRHIFNYHHLTEDQRQALLRIYLSFRHENEDQAGSGQAGAPDGDGPGADEEPGEPGPTPAPAGRGPTSAVG